MPNPLGLLIGVVYLFIWLVPVFVVDDRMQRRAEKKLGFKIRTFAGMNTLIWTPDIPTPTKAQFKAVRRFNFHFLAWLFPTWVLWSLISLRLFGWLTFNLLA